MLATLAEAPLVDPNLAYELKYDGIRGLIRVGEGRAPLDRAHRGRFGTRPRVPKRIDVTAAPEVSIISRLGNDKTAQFPEVVAALARWGRLRGAPALLDGEIVALDERGEPAGFQRLQDRMHLTGERTIERRAASQPIAFIAFDLLLDGAEDLCALPLGERRRRLEAAIAPALGDVIRIAKHVRGDGTTLMAEARAQGWEGIVAKDLRSPYRPGRRSLEWRKLKLVKQEEFVVGGYTEPRGSRAGFGALLLGVTTTPGRLRYTGHVGGGFTERELARLTRLLTERATADCPFEAPPPSNERPHWVRPELVVQVRFSNWTNEGYLRHPTYLGLRDDVRVADVRSETGPKRKAAAAPPEPAGGAERAGLLAALEALEEKGGGRLQLTDGPTLELTNLGKVLWPGPQLRKGDLFRYYIQVAPYLLPVVRDRPLVMKRLPDGVEGPFFYQHRAPTKPPRGVRIERLEGDDVEARFVGGTLATLLYMTQLASISQDPWFSRVGSPLEMDFAAIDLDPMDGASFARVRDVARWVGDELEKMGLTGFLKTSGSSGLHIYLPLRPGTPFEAGMLFCRIVAEMVAARHPEAATVERTVKKRDPTSVYIDYLQNVDGKTLACAYSARASDYAGASTPLRWSELDDKLDPRAFTIMTLPERLRETGDLWAGLHTSPGIDMEAALDRLRSR